MIDGTTTTTKLKTMFDFRPTECSTTRKHLRLQVMLLQLLPSSLSKRMMPSKERLVLYETIVHLSLVGVCLTFIFIILPLNLLYRMMLILLNPLNGLIGYLYQPVLLTIVAFCSIWFVATSLVPSAAAATGAAAPTVHANDVVHKKTSSWTKCWGLFNYWNIWTPPTTKSRNCGRQKFSTRKLDQLQQQKHQQQTRQHHRTIAKDHYYDYVVIGSGIAGLTTACILRQFDDHSKVCVLEQHDDVAGGSTHEYTLCSKNGTSGSSSAKYKFPSGLHYVIPVCEQLLQVTVGSIKPPVPFSKLGVDNGGGVYEKVHLPRVSSSSGDTNDLHIVNDQQLLRELKTRYPRLIEEIGRFEMLSAAVLMCFPIWCILHIFPWWVRSRLLKICIPNVWWNYSNRTAQDVFENDMFVNSSVSRTTTTTRSSINNSEASRISPDLDDQLTTASNSSSNSSDESSTSSTSPDLQDNNNNNNLDKANVDNDQLQEDVYQLTSYLCSLWLDTGCLPQTVSFFMIAAVCLGFPNQGGVYPNGGPEAISKCLIQRIEDKTQAKDTSDGGGSSNVFVRAPVKRIITSACDSESSSSAVGVEIKPNNASENDNEESCYTLKVNKSIISACGYRNTRRLLGSNDEDKHEAVVPPQGSSFCMVNIGFKKGTAKILGLECCNYWIQPGGNGQSIFDGIQSYIDNPLGVPITEIPLMITFPSLKDRDYESKNNMCHTAQILTIANIEWFNDDDTNSRSSTATATATTTTPKRSNEYLSLKQQWIERLRMAFDRYYPHLKDQIELFDLATPFTIEHYLPTNGSGSAIGLDANAEIGAGGGRDGDCCRFTNFDTMKELDMKHPFDDTHNLWMTGQDTLMFGVPLAQVSGIITALRILGFGKSIQFVSRSIWLLLNSWISNKQKQQ